MAARSSAAEANAAGKAAAGALELSEQAAEKVARVMQQVDEPQQEDDAA